MVINCFLPAIPFIHSGYELGEKFPINTGLDFTGDQLKHLPSEKLPLFSEYAYDWLNDNQFPEWIARLLTLRQRYHDMIVDPSPQSFRMLHENNDHVIAFARVHPDDDKRSRRVGIVANANCAAAESVSVKVETALPRVTDLLCDAENEVRDQHINVTLAAGQCLVFEF
jgi:hypothetical protein